MKLSNDLARAFNFYFWIATLSSLALVGFGYATASPNTIVYGIIGVCTAIPMKFVGMAITRKLKKQELI